MKIMIHPTAIVEGKVSNGTKVWHHSHIRGTIGENCVIGKNVYIDADVVIGNNCKIQNNVSIYNAKIGNFVFIGPSVVFTNDLYPRASVWNPNKKAPITVLENGCSVGANSTLIAGIEIGSHAMVGAGSVVTKDVRPSVLVYGNPAKEKCYINKMGEKVGQI